MQNTRSYNDEIESAENFKMRFGKFMHKPHSYLRWLAANCENDAIAIKADTVMQWRDRNGIVVTG